MVTLSATAFSMLLMFLFTSSYFCLFVVFFVCVFFQASKYIPDICVIRAVQKIVWASGCGSVQLVFSSNEEISKIYEKVRMFSLWLDSGDGSKMHLLCKLL